MFSKGTVLMEENKIIYNSKFQLNIFLKNKKQLEYIPSNIYMFKPPSINIIPDVDLCFKEMNGVLCVRLDEEGKIENEIYETLANDAFNLKLYYPNKDCLNWEYNHCEIDTIEYDEFYNKSKNDRPYNLVMNLNIMQAIYHSNTGSVRVFGADSLPEEKGTFND